MRSNQALSRELLAHVLMSHPELNWPSRVSTAPFSKEQQDQLAKQNHETAKREAEKVKVQKPIPAKVPEYDIWVVVYLTQRGVLLIELYNRSHRKGNREVRIECCHFYLPQPRRMATLKKLPPKPVLTEMEKIAEMRRQLLGPRQSQGSATSSTQQQSQRAPSPPPALQPRKPSAISLTEFITSRIPPVPVSNVWASRVNSLTSLSEAAGEALDAEPGSSTVDFPSIGDGVATSSGAAASATSGLSIWTRRPAVVASAGVASDGWARGPETMAGEEEPVPCSDASAAPQKSDVSRAASPGLATPLTKAQRKNTRRQERKAAVRAAEELLSSSDPLSQPGTPSVLASYPPSELSAADVLTGERLLRASSAQGTDESSGASNSPCHGARAPAATELAARALQRRVVALAALGFEPSTVVRAVGGGAGLDARAALRTLLSATTSQQHGTPLLLDLRAEYAAASAGRQNPDWDGDFAAHCWPCGGLFCGEPHSALSLSDWVGDGYGRTTCCDAGASFAVPAPCALAALPAFVALVPEPQVAPPRAGPRGEDNDNHM